MLLILWSGTSLYLYIILYIHYIFSCSFHSNIHGTNLYLVVLTLEIATPCNPVPENSNSKFILIVASVTGAANLEDVSNDSFGRSHAIFMVYPAWFCAIFLPDHPSNGNSLENLRSVFETEPLRDRRYAVAVSNRWTVSGTLKCSEDTRLYLFSIISLERLRVHESVAAFEPVSPNRIWILTTDGGFHGNGFWSTLDSEIFFFSGVGFFCWKFVGGDFSYRKVIDERGNVAVDGDITRIEN